MHLGDSVFEDSDPSDTDLWSSATSEEKATDTISSRTSDSDVNQDLSFTENFFIDENYLIYGVKLGMSIDYIYFFHHVISN